MIALALARPFCLARVGHARVGGRTGSEIANSLIGRSPLDREKIVLNAVKNGEVPRRLSDRSRWCLVSAAGGRLLLTVACRPVELGTDEDSFLAPMRPATAQAIADHFGAILPSRLLVDLIWRAAEVRLPIGPPRGFKIPGPDMLDPRSWIASSANIEKLIAGRKGLVAGGKKSIVVGPGLDGSRVAIYSTPFSGSGEPRPKNGHQPYSTIHTVDHVDYSHAAPLVGRMALVDGVPVDLMLLFQDPNPARHGLVSDQGPFLPRFPNVVGVRAAYALGGAGPSPDKSQGVPSVQPPLRHDGVFSHATPAEHVQQRKNVGGQLGFGAGVIGAAAIGLSWPWVLIFGGGGALVGKYLMADELLRGGV